jgi:sporadic carbohydrate cluster protein (TIGR04323 family)
MKKKYAGYINLKNLNGVLYPSSTQNIIMKDYIDSINGIFYLSPTEVLQSKHPITLRTLLGKETNVNGIVMLSSFYLPETEELRNQIYMESVKFKKTLHFILDELVFDNKDDKLKIEEYLFYNTNFFTQTRKKLNKFEEKIIKNYKNITFV